MGGEPALIEMYASDIDHLLSRSMDIIRLNAINLCAHAGWQADIRTRTEQDMEGSRSC